MTRIVLVADGKFEDYHKFMWAATVAIDEANSKDIELLALGNQSLRDITSEYVGKVSDYLEGKGVKIRDGFFPYIDWNTFVLAADSGQLLDKDTASVLVLTKLDFVPFKEFVSRAKARNIEVKTF